MPVRLKANTANDYPLLGLKNLLYSGANAQFYDAT